jgi:hypothetical protein
MSLSIVISEMSQSAGQGEGNCGDMSVMVREVLVFRKQVALPRNLETISLLRFTQSQTNTDLG